MAFSAPAKLRQRRQGRQGRQGQQIVLTDLFVRQLVAAAVPRQPYFAVRTQSRAERQVRDQFLAGGFEPLQLKFFPGYVFARFHEAQRLRISEFFGVHSIVGFAATPSPADEEEMSALVRVVESRLPVGPAPYHAKGIPRRLKAGPLEGVSGSLLGRRGEMSMVVSLSILQRSVAVAVEEDWVGPVIEREFSCNF